MRSASFSASQLGAQLWLINRAGFHATFPSRSCSSFSVKIYSLFRSHRRNDSPLLILSPKYSRMGVPLRTVVFANPPVPWIEEPLNKTSSVSATWWPPSTPVSNTNWSILNRHSPLRCFSVKPRDVESVFAHEPFQRSLDLHPAAREGIHVSQPHTTHYASRLTFPSPRPSPIQSPRSTPAATPATASLLLARAAARWCSERSPPAGATRAGSSVQSNSPRAATVHTTNSPASRTSYGTPQRRARRIRRTPQSRP